MRVMLSKIYICTTSIYIFVISPMILPVCVCKKYIKICWFPREINMNELIFCIQ